MGVRITAAALSAAAEKAGIPDLFTVSRPGDGSTQYVLDTEAATLSSKNKDHMSLLIGMIAGHAHDGTPDVGDKVDFDLSREGIKRSPDAFAAGFKRMYDRVTR